MATFLQLQKRAERLTPQKISRDLFAFVRTLEKRMADYNRFQISENSKDVFGKPIGFYSRATEQISEGRKPFGTPFTLFDTGVFLPSLFAKVQGQQVLFGATDPKTGEVLENLLSKDIFGLSDNDLNNLIVTDIRPFLLKYIPKQLIA